MQQCWHDLKVLFAARRLLWTMTKREMASRYAGSVFGVFWAYLQPVLIIAAYFLVFDVVFSMRMGESAPTSRVGTYLVVGTLPWLAFCESLSRGASSLVEAGGILQKNALPPVLFVTRSVLASLLVYTPLMVVLTLFYLPVSGFSWAHLALPVLLIAQGVLVLVLAYILAILTAAVRDTAQVLAFALQVGIFLSPVLFPVTLFPEQWRWVLYANPMSAIVQAYQAILLSGRWPEAPHIVAILIWIGVLTVALNGLIRHSRDQLVDWL